MQNHKAGGSARNSERSGDMTTPSRNTGMILRGSMVRGETTLSPYAGLFKPYVYRGKDTLTPKQRQQQLRAAS